MKLIKAGFSGGGLGHGNGANLAPDKVVEMLENCFADEYGKNVSFDVESIELDENDIQLSHDNIQKKMSENTEKAIVIGGDHSVTYPCVKAFAKNKKDFSFIVFDAHPDLMDDFRPPTQEDYLKVLIEEGIVKAENVFIIGIRNWDEQEINYLKEKNISHYNCADIFDRGIKDVMKDVLAKVSSNIYLSIDVDCVDPVEAIGTGYIEHGGMSSRELIFALQEIKKTGKLSMVDLVEINPKKDVNDMTSILGAKIITELANTSYFI